MKGTKLLFLTLGICIGIDNGETMKTLCLLLSLENLKKKPLIYRMILQETQPYRPLLPLFYYVVFLFVAVTFLTIYKGFTLCYRKLIICLTCIIFTEHNVT